MKIETYPKFIKGFFVGLQSKRRPSNERKGTQLLKAFGQKNDWHAVNHHEYEYSDYMPWMNQF